MRKPELRNAFRSKKLVAAVEAGFESFKTRKELVGGYAEKLYSKDIDYLNEQRFNKRLDRSFGLLLLMALASPRRNARMLVRGRALSDVFVFFGEKIRSIFTTPGLRRDGT